MASMQRKSSFHAPFTPWTTRSGGRIHELHRPSYQYACVCNQSPTFVATTQRCAGMCRVTWYKHFRHFTVALMECGVL